VSKWAECLSSGPNRLDCFVVGTDGAIWHRWWDGNTWQGWTSLNGTVLSFGGPSCTSWAIWRIDCFVIGTDSSLWHNWTNDGVNWAGWHSRGWHFVGPPKCVSADVNTIHCLGVGYDPAVGASTGGLYANQWINGVSSGWKKVGPGAFNNKVDCVAWTTNKSPRIDCFYTFLNSSSDPNRLKHIFWMPP
jgi:hypothetical protein